MEDFGSGGSRIFQMGGGIKMDKGEKWHEIYDPILSLSIPQASIFLLTFLYTGVFAGATLLVHIKYKHDKWMTSAYQLRYLMLSGCMVRKISHSICAPDKLPSTENPHFLSSRLHTCVIGRC